MEELRIRAETSADYLAVRELTTAAFAGTEYGYNGEAELVEQLRHSTGCLSLVALSGHDVIGHILFSPVTIRSQQSSEVAESRGMGLAPLSVLPSKQRQGVGKALVNEGLGQLRAAGCPFVVVLGDPDYYSRFEFVQAASYNVTHGFAGIPQPFFQMIIFNQQIRLEQFQGRAYYEPAFGPQHVDAD